MWNLSNETVQVTTCSTCYGDIGACIWHADHIALKSFLPCWLPLFGIDGVRIWIDWLLYLLYVIFAGAATVPSPHCCYFLCWFATQGNAVGTKQTWVSSCSYLFRLLTKHNPLRSAECLFIGNVQFVSDALICTIFCLFSCLFKELWSSRKNTNGKGSLKRRVHVNV